jgi:hypothetical protein
MPVLRSVPVSERPLGAVEKGLEAQFAAASRGGLEHAAMIEIAALIAIDVFNNSVSS